MSSGQTCFQTHVSACLPHFVPVVSKIPQIQLYQVHYPFSLTPLKKSPTPWSSYSVPPLSEWHHHPSSDTSQKPKSILILSLHIQSITKSCGFTLNVF